MSAARGRRLLSDAEIEIWLKIAQSVTARPGATLPQRKVKPAGHPPATVAAAASLDLPPKRPPSGVPGYTPPSQPRAPTHPPLAPLEKRYRQRIAHGRIEIDGVMDLHGLTQAEAHRALNGFLRSAQQNGSRLVLIVTGKGRPRPLFGAAPPAGESGVLRRAVPHWLGAPELRSVVLGFEEASLPHGGMGALYVRLRRSER